MTDAAPTAPRSAFRTVRFDHACFGCGDDNPIGLHLQFTLTEDGVAARFTPEPAHQGFDDVVHGGIISTVLDEAMAWAVTAEISVRFKTPLAVGEEVTVTARVTDNRGRLVATTGAIARDRDGATIATAAAKFVRVSGSLAAQWQSRSLQLENLSSPADSKSRAADEEMIRGGGQPR
jgi:acyl-coenzyme A thioesterase PaaI-like protein